MLLLSAHAPTHALTRDGDYLLLEGDDQFTLSGPTEIKDVVITGTARLTIDGISGSAPDLTVRNDGSVLIRNSGVGLVYLYENGAVVMEDATSNSHITARDNAKLTLRNARVEGIIEASEGARLDIHDAAAELLHLKGNNQVHLADFVACKGKRDSSGGFNGGEVIYTSQTQINLYADDVVFVDGTLFGYGGNGERFSYRMLEDTSAIEVAKAMPAQVVVQEAMGPSFTCGSGATRVEKMICANKDLALLDKRVTRAYKESVLNPTASTSIQNAQKNWLSGMRDRCVDAPCLRAAYDIRLRELAKSTWMTNAKEAAICNAVVNAVNDGTIENSFIPFRTATETERARWKRFSKTNGSTAYLWQVLNTRIGGRPRSLGLIGGGGSCGSCTIADLDAHAPALLPDEDPGERLRWANWGMCDHLAFIEGEPVIIAGRFGSGESEATLVSWLAPDGAQRALCYLHRSGRPLKTQTVRNDDPELCQATLEGKVPFLSWEAWPLSPSVLDGLAIRADRRKRADFDIDMDGQAEAIALVDHASGVGCGAYSQSLLALSDDGSAILDTPVSALFNPDAAWGPIKGVAAGDADHPDFSVKLFHFREKPYVLRRANLSSAEVVSLWQGQLRTWCEYRNLPQYTVELLYPVETWPTAVPVRNHADPAAPSPIAN